MAVISSRHVTVIYVCHLNFTLLYFKLIHCKNRILSLFIREEMFLKILTKWPFQAAKKNYVREI